MMIIPFLKHFIKISQSIINIWSYPSSRLVGGMPLPESCLAEGQLQLVLLSVRNTLGNNLTFPLKLSGVPGSWREEHVRSVKGTV